MVNTDIVNAGSLYFLPATFCESFRVFGRISRFQNPFKYTRGFNINQYFDQNAPAEAIVLL